MMNVQAAKASRDVALPATYQLGEYVVENVLGHGGFGITYLARDTKLASQVAIKEYFPQAFAYRNQQSTILPTTDGGENYEWGLQEFLKEARALAKFKHNHIVRVLRFLETNGTAYMVMEYEEGGSLAAYLRKTGGFLNEATLLGIFLPILGGLQAVHDAGLLHLDIKPDNIYLRSNGQPMLIDFGSARQTKSKTEQDQKIALTPAYASIEHYPNFGKQGPWTDVYSMGATLYRCTSGTEPAGAMDRFQGLRDRRIDPMRPTVSFDRPHYASHIRECVDWALKLSPRDRPHTAFALQRGLMGHGMSNEKAGPQAGVNVKSGFIGISKVITLEETHKIRRGFIEKLLIGLVVLAAISIMPIKVLLQNEQISKTELYGAIDYIETKAKTALGIVDEKPTLPPPRPKSTRPTKKAPPPFNASKVLAHTLIGHGGVIESIAFLSDGNLLASNAGDGVVRLWNVESGTLQHTVPVGAGSGAALAASPDGRWLAMVRGNVIALWDSKENEPAGELVGHEGTIRRMAFSPDGRILASVGVDRSVILWNLSAKQVLQRLGGYEHDVLTVAFAPNGRRIATSDASGQITYWEVPTGKLAGYFRAHDEEITAIAFSPDGKWLATGGADKFLTLWDTGLERNDQALFGAPETVYSLAFSHDSQWLLVAGTGDAIRIWDLRSGEPVHRLRGQNQEVYVLALSSDGKVLASAGGNQIVEVWQ
ncbi:MAG: protein kinase [Acidiferrobacterales bacterium]